MTRYFGIAAVAGVMTVGLLTAACGTPRSTNASSDTSTTSSSTATSTSTTTASSAADSGKNTASGAGGDGSGGATAANGQCLTGNLKVTAGGGDAGAGPRS